MLEGKTCYLFFLFCRSHIILSCFSGISHSAISDMKTIEQENVQSTPSTLSSLGKLRLNDNDSFFDDYGTSFSMNRNFGGGSGFGSNKIDSFLSDTCSSSNKDSWVIIDDPPDKPKSSSQTYGEYNFY